MSSFSGHSSPSSSMHILPSRSAPIVPAAAQSSSNHIAEVPCTLIYRTFEYSAMPSNIHAWRNRHRDLPCIFRDSIKYLFPTSQRAELQQLFHQGWKTDVGHPLLSCEGSLYVTSALTGLVAWPASLPFKPAESYYPVSTCINTNTNA